MDTVYCTVSKQNIPIQKAYKGNDLRKELFDLIQNEHPDFTPDSFVSIDILNVYRKRYLTQLIALENGEVDQLENKQ